MAFTVQIMEDGPRNAILWIDGVGDSAVTAVITTAQLGYVDQARLQRAQGLRIDRIEWDINNADGTTPGWIDLLWDATTDASAYHMVGRANKYFKDFGGLHPAAGLAGNTGGINLVTQGLGDAVTGGAYTIILYLVKLLPNP